MKKKNILLTAFLFLMVSILSFSLTKKDVKAETETPTPWSGYQVVKDGETFKGIGLTDSVDGELTVNIPSTEPYYTADYVKTTLGDTSTDFKVAWAVVTFELDEAFSTDDYNTLLIQIDRRMSSNNTGPMILLETTNGTIYGVNSGTARNDAYINFDGTATTWANETAARFTFKGNMGGTLNLNLANKWQRVAGTKETGDEKTICKVHYCMDSSGSFKWYGDRPVGFGTFAAANTTDLNNITVKKLLSVQDLVFTTDATNTTADVNLADMTKGTKVYAKHTVNRSASPYIWDPNPNYCEIINSVWEVKRVAEITIKAQDEEGAVFSTSTKFVTFNGTNYDANITPPTVLGYTYKEADKALDGTCNAKDVFTLTYKYSPVVEVNYVDYKGEVIKTKENANTVASAEAGKYDYNITPPQIEGYAFKEADKALTGTIEGNSSITLTYLPTLGYTIKFVDTDNESIKNDVTGYAVYNETTTKYDYEVTQKFVEGYSYKEADKELTGSVDATFTITLKFEKIEEAAPQEVDYKPIYADGVFKGFYIIASTSNSFAVSMPVKSDACPFLTPDVVGDDFIKQWAMITFKFDHSFSLDEFDTLLVQIDRSMSTQNTGPTFFIEASDGTLYRLNSKSNNNDVVIADNGAIASHNDASGGFRYTLNKGINGTLNIPLSRMTKVVQGTLETGNSKEIVKMYYCMDTSGTYNWWGDRPVGFGVIAAASSTAKELKVQELLVVQNCTTTTDAEDTTADINLANLKNGKKVFTEHTIFTDWKMDANPKYVDRINSLWVVSSVPHKMTIKCVDASNNVLFVGYSNLSLTDGGYSYNVTAPTVYGYTYKSADKDLTGTVLTDSEIVLTYEKNVSVTIQYVDENGTDISTVKNIKVLPATLNTETNKYSYSVVAPEFVGYYLTETVGDLEKEITEDVTLKFVYHSLPTFKVITKDFDGETMEEITLFTTHDETGYKYEVVAPQYEGYIFLKSSHPLTGAYTDGLEVVITYSTTCVIIKSVDEDGETLAEDYVVMPTVDATDENKFNYTVDLLEIFGYHYLSSTLPLTGQITESTTITVTYRALPTVTVKFVDGDNEPLRADSSLITSFDVETSKYSYSIDTNLFGVFGYDYKEADKALTGEFVYGAEAITVTLKYDKSTNMYDNFEVVKGLNDENETVFEGIWLKKSYAGSLNMNVSAYDGSLGYGLITVEFDKGVSPQDSTGILIQIERTDNSVGGLQLRMYLEDQYGNLYRLFTQTNDRVGSHDTTIIDKDGNVDYVENQDVNWRHWITQGREGTMYIPWNDISNVLTNEAIPAGTIFTKLHFGRETRYDTTINKPMALATVASVKVNDDLTAEVEMICDLCNLNYTNDATNTTADVNLADMTKGTKVYFRRWLSGTHIEQNEKLENIIALFEFSRVAPSVSIKFVDENGNKLRDAQLADATYGDEGSTYTVTPPEIPGYEFKSADKELTGVVLFDTEIVLTYKEKIYTITIKFEDESGNKIAEDVTITGKFGEYKEYDIPEIEGYAYKESEGNTKFTVIGDRQIKLIYSSNNPQGGNTTGSKKTGCKSSALTGLIFLPALIATVAFARKKKENF